MVKCAKVGGGCVVLLEVAAYIFFIVFVLVVATKVLWLVFFLFNFRVWESILTYEYLSKFIDFTVPRDYYILIIIISIVTYALVLLATQGIPVLRYILLLVMVLYTIRIYDIADILLFKDHLEASGVWNLSYWKEQGKELISFSSDDAEGIFQSLWNKFWGGINRFFDYIKGL